MSAAARTLDDPWLKPNGQFDPDKLLKLPEKMDKPTKARRYSSGKLRYDLIPHDFLKEVAKVFTMGKDKYSLYDENGNVIDDGADNWKKGLSWKETIAATIRHLEKFRDCKDFDYDWPKDILDRYGPSHHLGNAAWGLAVLIEFMRIHPELDDRAHNYLQTKRIGLDIDEVIAGFVQAYADRTGATKTPYHWNYCKNIKSNFDAWREDGTLDDFYTNIPAVVDGSNIGFEPTCYITARPVETEITEKWLLKNNFPMNPVFTVETPAEKLAVAKEQRLDYFIDDNFSTFVDLNKNGIVCFLYDAPHNRKYDVGYKRILGFDDFKKRFL